MTAGELIAQLSELPPSTAVLLGNAPGPLAHLTPTVNGFVILDKCTGGTCCGFTHAGMAGHDGYAPHSHEVRADHKGVKRDD